MARQKDKLKALELGGLIDFTDDEATCAEMLSVWAGDIEAPAVDTFTFTSHPIALTLTFILDPITITLAYTFDP